MESQFSQWDSSRVLALILCRVFFFFSSRRRHTRFDCDWSSDVCSSDLPIVLAAGASSRMGRPKALLDFDGRTALDLILEAVRGQGTPIVVLGPNHDEIRARVEMDGVQVAYNLEVDSGQTASLRAGLALLPPEA